MSFTLKIKCTSQLFTIEADNDLTIYDLKVIVSIESGIQPDRQTLLFKGRVCDDDSTLEEIGIEDNSMLILLQAHQSRNISQSDEKQNVNNSTNSGSGGGGHMQSDFMKQMMNSPVMDQMLSNPDIIQSLFGSSPALKQLLKDNPQMRHVLKDPALMKNAMKAATNPEYYNEMLKSNDRALRNIESIPGGFSALSRMYHQIQKPMERAMDDMYRQRFGKSKTIITIVDKSKGPTQTPLENPWAPKQTKDVTFPNTGMNMNNNSMLMNNNYYQMMGNHNQSSLIPTQTQSVFISFLYYSCILLSLFVCVCVLCQRNVSEIYALQLNELRSMGFLNEEQNVSALLATGGNVSAAAQYLLNRDSNHKQK